MRFSDRSAWDRRDNPLAAARRAREAAGLRLIDLTETNPTRCGLRAEASALEGLASTASLDYVPDPLGLEPAREAVARHLRTVGVDADPDAVLLTASTSEAFTFLFKLLCDPGDSVLVPVPGYPLLEHLTALDGVRARPYALSYADGWHLDVNAVEAAADSRTRAVIAVSPGNPTGEPLSEGEHAALQALCARRGWALICDEVFREYAWDGAPSPSAATSSREALTITLGGLSKLAALPQLKLSWLCAQGPEPLHREAFERLEVIADAYLSVATPVQHALPHLLEDIAPRLRAQVLARVRKNRAVLEHAFPPGTKATVLRARGGWASVLRVPLEPGEEETCLRLLEHGVAVQPGYFFDFPPGGAHLVLSLLPPPELFAEGVGLLAALVG